MIALLVVLALQDGLWSNDPAEREAAEAAIANDGALLRRLVKDVDTEVASRAGRMLRRFEFREAVGRKHFFAVYPNLVGDSENDWTSAYLWMMGQNDLRRTDVFLRARRGVETIQELHALVTDAIQIHVKEALPDLLALLDEPAFASQIYDGLRPWKATELYAELESRLASDDVEVRRRALELIMNRAGWLFDAVAARLRDPDEQVRRLAVLVLAHGGDRRALEAEHDEDAGVRRAVVQAIGVLRAHDRAPDVLHALGDDDPETRGTAAHTAASLGLAEALPWLVRLLDDRATRDDAMSAIAALGLGRAMVHLAWHEDAVIAAWAINVMKESLGPSEAGALLVHDDARIRFAAIYALDRRRASIHPIVLGWLARDSNGEVRDLAMHLLLESGLGMEEDVRRALASESAEMRRLAISCADAEFVEIIEERVNDTRADVRARLLDRDDLDVETIVRLAWDDDERIAESATYRLRRVDETRAFREMGRMLLDPLEARREMAVRGVMGAREVEPVILDGLRSADAEIRERAVRAFGLLRKEAMRKGLGVAFCDPDARVRSAAKEEAAWALACGDEMREMVLEPGTRAAALEVIGATNTWAFEETLLACRADRDPAIRRCVAKALRWVATGATRDALKELAMDSDADVRFAAVEGLVLLEGIEWAAKLIAFGRSLNALNALKDCYAWSRLAQQSIRDAAELFEGRAPTEALMAGDGLEEAGIDVVLERDAWRVMSRDEARKTWQAWLKTQTK